MGNGIGITVNKFDFSDECREQSINDLFLEAKNAPSRVFAGHKWKIMDDFYHSYAKTMREKMQVVDGYGGEFDDFLEEYKEALNLTDPVIQVESQVEVSIPEPVFKGRDRDNDYKKAKIREYVVKYILANNDIKSKATVNERYMLKYGDSFAKVYYDESISYDNTNNGDIKIEFVPLDDVFVDPCATSLDDAEYICYCYFMHRRKAERLYGKDFKKKDIDLDDLSTETRTTIEELNRDAASNPEAQMNQVMILEFWYRDDEGDIALSLLVNGKEFRHIKKYWKNTGKQNKNFPFIHFYRIKDEKNFYNTSELELIMPLTQASNQILNRSLENMEYLNNDIIVCEEDALAENEEITNEAGAIINVKQGRINSLRRLGGLNALQNNMQSLDWLQSQIQRTTRNYDSNMGKESERVTTASGLAQLRADSATQTNKKGFDRLQAYKRLFQLIDWCALEFYDEDRYVFIGTPYYQADRTTFMNPEKQMPMQENYDAKNGDIFFKFNSNNMKEQRNVRIVGLKDDNSNQVEYEEYYPSVDCEVSATNGVEQSKSFTIDCLQYLMKEPITVDNYKVAIELVRELGIPQAEMIIDKWLETFEPSPIEGLDPQLQAALNPQQQQMIRQNPQLIAMAQAVANQQAMQGQIKQGAVPTPQAPRVSEVRGANKFAGKA